jgi:phage-related protein
MYCLKIKGIDYLIIKKAGGIKMYFTNKFESVIYVTHVFHSSSPSFNSTLPKKTKQLGVNFGQKSLIV